MNVLQKIDGSISSPSTPNCTGGGCSSTVSTPTSQQQQVQGSRSGAVPPAPPSASSSGHKNSLKGTKLARRARSFKDDLIEKISLMRTTNNTLGRSHSPHSPRNRHASNKPPPTTEEVQKSTQTLEAHVKDISNALKHFRDVILKKKLEVLPGNGTVILETIASMYSVIQSYTLNENSAIMSSATQQVYQSLGKLIKLCDEVMLSEKSGECAALSDENVREVIDLLEDAVRNLVTLAQSKLKEQDQCSFRYSGAGIGGIGAAADIIGAVTATTTANTIRPPVETAAQRTSLPDIGLTPKERDILEQTNANPMRASHSTESILRDTSPPPKPPLPNRSSNPPPLPPKRRSQPQPSPQPYTPSNNVSVNSGLDCFTNFSLINYGVDHLSVRSRSPDENSSQCSFDSALNHSRDEEEQQQQQYKHQQQQQIQQNQSKQLTMDDNLLDDDTDKLISYKTHGDINVATQREPAAASASTVGQMSTAVAGIGANTTGDNLAETNTELRTAAAALNSNRHSNESGFVSMKSFRTSTQSVSKRSSDYSVQSSTKSSSSNSEIAFSISETTTTTGATRSTSSDYQQNHQSSSSSSNQRHVSATTTTTSSNSNSTSTYCEQEQAAQALSNSSASPELNHVKLSEALTEIAPALPPKLQRQQMRSFESNDELDEVKLELAELRQTTPHHYQSSSQLHQWQYKHHSLIEPPRIANLAGSCTGFDRGLDKPPPLPMKKKSILTYMELCSGSTGSIEQHRHTMHCYNMTRNLSHSQTMNIMPMSKDLSPEQETPPALPPKNCKQRKPTATTLHPTIITTPPPSPKPQLACENIGNGLRNSRMTTVCEEFSDVPYSVDAPTVIVDNNENVETSSPSGQVLYCHSHQLPNESSTSPVSPCDGDQSPTPVSTPKLLDLDKGPEEEELDEELEEEEEQEEDNHLPNMLEEIDITPYLILKKKDEDGPEVKGGYIDALIVHASRVQKVADNSFSEAFITTFRTFIQPIDVIEKLTHRYTYFFCQVHDQKQKAAKETFSLLVRVVNDLTSNDLTSQLLSLLVEFVYQLVCSGQLYLAKLLRNKFVEKVTLYKDNKRCSYPLDIDNPVSNQPSMLDLKSLEIAEQMTLLDAELFQKIEIPEVLLFAKDQCEEKSPNLNNFTEHFNKMSYWARTKILRLQDAKEREKHVNKFVKIMKHLRKMNNYNSYLALLSALDSGPIRRLEWQKGTTEEVRSFCALIDSSSSFRAYRQALAETNPPCIPYIGLVLQDLTFVHVGNQDYLSKGVINFSKRWQQYNIIVNMKRFKKCAYPFRRNERIISFFENFKDFTNEEEMWQISEKIKPRGRRPVNY